MAIESYTTQLERVQAAIAKLEAGAQSYAIDNHVYTRPDLQTLYDREKWLRSMVGREARGGMRIRYGVPLP